MHSSATVWLVSLLVTIPSTRTAEFGTREGQSVPLTRGSNTGLKQKTGARNGALPALAWKQDEIFTHYEHLPDEYPQQQGPDAGWRADALRFQDEIQALQNSCGSVCVSKEIETDGIGSTLSRLMIGPQDVWGANTRVLYTSTKPWEWSKKDTALNCDTLFGCYLAPLSKCNNGTEETVPEKFENGDYYYLKAKYFSKVSKWPSSNELGNPERWFLVPGLNKDVVLVNDAPICWEQEAYLTKGVRRSSRDHWHFQKWGIVKHEAALVDLILRFSTPFQSILDETLAQLGLKPKDNPCIAMHVRHGKITWQWISS
jgi:hypothetical protein